MKKLPETSAIIKGGYENKIRRSSPIEKVFEVFATKRTKEGLRMTFFDLMRAVCPFNYSTKSADDMKKYLEENPPKRTMELLDLDGDHHLNVYEFYIFWVFHESKLL